MTPRSEPNEPGRVKETGRLDASAIDSYIDEPVAAADRDRPISSEAELVAHFHTGSRTPDRFVIGAEHEKIGVYTTPGEIGRAIPYEGERGIRRILDRLAARGYTAIAEGDAIIALDKGGDAVSLEPGGQLENSGPARRTAAEVARLLDAHYADVEAASGDLGIAWLGIGYRPFGARADVPWMPKGRYGVMRTYLPTRGQRGLDMMLRTATVQANLDYCDEADAAQKLRTAFGVSSIMTALWAASPLEDGRPCGHQSLRAACWLDTDPDRCGLLPFVFEERDAVFEAYAQWALDVPMFFLYRDGYRPAGGVTFRRFLRDGIGGERATISDWVLHLSTLFPEVRLKTFLEIRGADASTRPMVRALPAFLRGLLYAPDATRAAWSMVRGLSLAEREALRREVPRLGLSAEVGGRRVRDLAREVVAIARAGLLSLPDGAADAPLLAPLEEVAKTGRSVADEVLDAHAASDGDVAAFIERVRLR